MNKLHKLAACFLLGTMILAGSKTNVFASVNQTPNADVMTGGEPVAGIVLALDEIYQKNDNAEKVITNCLSTESNSEFKNLAFADVSYYVNIRSEASEDSEILGKLYDDSAATIIDKKNDWYQISSGSVKGYIKGEFLVTGDKAVALAKSVGSKVATVTTTTLKVREKASLDAEVLTLIPEGDEFKVVKEKDGWVQVALGGNRYGYVSTDYVKIQMEYEEAISIEEEQERINEEAAVAAESEPRNHSSSSNQHTSTPSKPVSKPTSSAGRDNSGKSSSNLGSRIANYAVQFTGNPYVWGGTSLTNGADCSGFTQSVFAHFGISIPRTSRTQAAGGSRVSINDLDPGDLIFYTGRGTINHVAIYIGNGKVISASSPSTGIRITSYNYRQPYKAVSYID